MKSSIVPFIYLQEYDATQKQTALQKGNKKDISKFSLEDDVAGEKLQNLKLVVKQTKDQVI